MRFDHIDIGTSDFDVADGVFSPDKNYLLVEPMQEYLDRLPSGEHIRKEYAACSDSSGEIEIFYIPEETIFKFGLPIGFKGCNRIGKPHKVASEYIKNIGLDESIIHKKIVPVIEFDFLVNKYGIESIGHLKIDTEGHDHIILRQIVRCILSGKISCEKITVEYIVGAFGNTDEIDVHCILLKNHFPNISISNDNLTLYK